MFKRNKKIKELEAKLEKAQEKNKKLEEILSNIENKTRCTHIEECDVYSSKVPSFDELSKQVMFEKMGSTLPLVFDYNNPINIYSFQEWTGKIKRSEIISSICNEELKSYFEEMTLSQIITKFHCQLRNHYKKRVDSLVAKHNEILYEHYHHDLDDKNGDNTKGENK